MFQCDNVFDMERKGIVFLAKLTIFTPKTSPSGNRGTDSVIHGQTLRELVSPWP